MPYLNLDLDYFTHPKTRRLIGLLGGVSEVYPLRLWCYIGKYHASDGCLSDYSVQEFESILGWTGDNGKLFEAMKRVGFVHQDSRGIYVHDWLDHEGHLHYFKQRAKAGAISKWGIDKTNFENKKKRSQRLSEARTKGKHNAAQWEYLKSYFKDTCVMCMSKDIEVVKDHIVPIYQGGSDGIDNIQPLCRTCNASKGPDNTDMRINFLSSDQEEGKRLLDVCLNACERLLDACSNQPNQPNLLNQTNQTNQTGGADCAGLDCAAGFGLEKRLVELGLKPGISSKYKHDDIAEVLRLYDTKIKKGETFKNPQGWILSELKKLDTSDIAEDKIMAMIEILKTGEAYARGNCPPPGKTLRQYAIEKLRRNGKKA